MPKLTPHPYTTPSPFHRYGFIFHSAALDDVENLGRLASACVELGIKLQSEDKTVTDINVSRFFNYESSMPQIAVVAIVKPTEQAPSAAPTC